MDRSENVGQRVQVDALVVWGSWWPWVHDSCQEPALGQFPWMAHKPPLPPHPNFPIIIVLHFGESRHTGTHTPLGFCLLGEPHQAVLRGVCGARKEHQASYMNSPCCLSDAGT